MRGRRCRDDLLACDTLDEMQLRVSKERQGRHLISYFNHLLSARHPLFHPHPFIPFCIYLEPLSSFAVVLSALGLFLSNAGLVVLGKGFHIPPDQLGHVLRLYISSCIPRSYREKNRKRIRRPFAFLGRITLLSRSFACCT